LDGESQDQFPWIKDKFLRNVVNHKSNFYLVTSKDYDRDIDILNSEDPEFNATVDRFIEPGMLEVFDSLI
jgi:hypothetical protein